MPVTGPFVGCLALLIAGCATYDPKSIDEVPFRQRADTQTQGAVTVSTAALSIEEAERLFQIPLGRQRVQPVWVQVENRDVHAYFFLPIAIDADYFSPDEIAYRNRSGLTKEAKTQMERHLRDEQMPFYVPPGTMRAGFVYTNVDEGAKVIDVMLVSEEEDREVKSFNFVVEVPGLQADYLEVDFDNLYRDEELRHLQTEEELRRALEALPCCVLAKNLKTPGDPMNLVVIGNGADILGAFMRRNWDLTETTHEEAIEKTIASSVFGAQYRYSPVSALYVYDRPQDVALQKARHTVDERNHLRLWLSPLRYRGQEVWVGQISRDIGVKFSRKTFVTHAIDPDVDDTRAYLVQDLIFSQSVSKLGYVKGVGAAPVDEPRYNYTEDPYFTDGLRAVLVITHDLHGLADLEAFEWEVPRRRQSDQP